MLFDPKWEKKTKAAPLSLESLIAWLEKQPADTDYDYCSPWKCVLARFLGGFCSKEEQIAIIGRNQHIIQDHPRTFGAALERARAALNP